MSAEVRRLGKLTTRIDLTDLENYIVALKKLGQGDILEKAAKHLQVKAINAMKKQYFNTAVGRIDNKRSRASSIAKGEIESKLFGNVPAPLKKGNKRIDFKIWAGYGAIGRDVPHLKWQEEGTKGMVDQQPYQITNFRPGNKGRPWKLKSIKKSEASSKRQFQGSVSSSGQFNVRRTTDKNKRFASQVGIVGSVFNIQVPHHPLKPRGFIAAGNFLIKTQGDKIVTDFVKRELAKARNQK